VGSIGNEAFSECRSLESITVNGGNTEYDSRGNCNAIIETATNKLILGCANSTIPEGVTEIGNNAFRGCRNLQSVHFPNSLKKVGNSTNEKKYNYAIITPYQAQVKRFKEKFIINNIEIAINTVDSFQGQERDIVLFSTVRSSKKNNSINDNQGGGESIGFLKDFRRMNVALSRAKLGCFIIGNSQKLISNSYWEKLINFCKMKKCFYMIDSPKEFNQKIEYIFLSKV
jgi:hypothetical protein